MRYDQECNEAAGRILTRVHGHLLSIGKMLNLPAVDCSLAHENTVLIQSLDVIAKDNKDAIDAEDVLCDLDNAEAKEAAENKILLPVKWEQDGDTLRSVCPFCDVFSDDCGDISHGQCDFCDAPLSECFDDHDNEFWDCANGCKHSAGYYYALSSDKETN